jgi:hypothetical protein
VSKERITAISAEVIVAEVPIHSLMMATNQKMLAYHATYVPRIPIHPESRMLIPFENSLCP